MAQNLRKTIEAFEQEVDGCKPSVLSELLGCPFCGASKWEISFYGIEGRSQAKLNHEPDCFFHSSTRLFLPSDTYIEWNRRAT